MHDLVKELGKLGMLILDNLAGLSILTGFLFWVINRTRNRINNTIATPNKAQDVVLNQIMDRLDQMEEDNITFHKETNKNILRIQIEDGIHRRKFSESEVMERYDRYKNDYNGNGYVTRLVHDYVESLHEEQTSQK